MRRYTYDLLACRGQPGVSVLRAQDHIFDVEVVALSIVCLGKGRIDAPWRLVPAGSVDMYLETRTACRGESHLSEM